MKSKARLAAIPTAAVAVWLFWSYRPPEDDWPSHVLLLLGLVCGIAGFVVRRVAGVSRVLLLAALSMIALAVGAMFFEPGTAGIERRYDDIQPGMTAEDVSEIMGEESHRKAKVRFNFEENKSEVRQATVWRFRAWDRPFVILVGFDGDGRVSWKRLTKGAFKKLGHWLFNTTADYFDGLQPLWTTVTEENE